MGGVNVGYGLLANSGKTGLRISAKQGELFIVAELVPDAFEMHRGRNLFAVHHHGDHLTECPHVAAIMAGAFQKFFDNVFKKRLIWPAVHHKTIEEHLGVIREVLIPNRRTVNINTGSIQP